MLRLEEIRKGDIVTYRNGQINYVNKPHKYNYWFNDSFYNVGLDLQIVKIQRYVKFLGFYRLKTIYKKGTK